MPEASPAEPAGNPEPDDEGRTARQRRRDRHGRREPRSTSKRTGPRYTVGPPKTVPMTADEYQQAVRAWAVLIASWWTDNPPDEDNDDN